MIGKPHPNLWEFIDDIKDEYRVHDVRLLQALGGIPPPAKRRRFQAINQAIFGLHERYIEEELERDDYLYEIGQVAFHDI